MNSKFVVQLGDGKNLEPFSVASAVDMAQRGDLILRPEYQTGPRWRSTQKAKLIDSIICGLDLPKLYFRRTQIKGEEKYEVVDGQQRLLAISEFLNEKFTLTSGPHKGKSFSKLAMDIRKKIQEFELHVVILTGNRWSDEVIRDLFLRLQMGTPLNAAEKRRALPGSFPIIVAKLANHKLFGENTGISENRFGYEDAVAKILHLVLNSGRPTIVDKAIRKTYEANKDIVESNPQVVLVRKTFDYLAKSLKNSGEYFKKFNILSVVTALVDLSGEYSLSGTHREVGDLLWQIESDRKQNDDLAPNDPNRNAILAKLSETARSDHTDHLEWRKDFYLAQFIQLGFTPLDPKRLFSNLERGILMRLQNGRCNACDCKITAKTGHVDHIKPYVKGGLTILENAQLLCAACNIGKGAKL
jgi:hypothetical protein